MGLMFSSLWSWWHGSKEHKIVMVGLDNAGKTTLLYKLHLGEVVVSQATVGSNVETINYKNLTLEVWDLGGQTNLRPFWSTYYQGTDAVIVVVDSTDRARLGMAKAELFHLLTHPHLAAAPVLVFANKQDLRGAMSASELSDALGLHAIKSHDWGIQACSAVAGTGLMDGLQWIHQKLVVEKKGQPAAGTGAAAGAVGGGSLTTGGASALPVSAGARQ